MQVELALNASTALTPNPSPKGEGRKINLTSDPSPQEKGENIEAISVFPSEKCPTHYCGRDADASHIL